jgi:hypothetical protein
MLSVGAVILLLLAVLAGAIWAIWLDMKEDEHNRHVAKHRCPDKNCKEHLRDFENPT